MYVSDIQVPTKVKFKQAFFDDDFVEEGMIALLTKIEFEMDHYILHFNFSGFEDHNFKLLTNCYYPNKHTGFSDANKLYTAIEAGVYHDQLECYYYVEDDSVDEFIEFI